jgi:hypothetical protein
MGCITSGVTRDCTTKISGGSNLLYIADRADIASLTYDVDGSVNGITMVATKVFFKFAFAPNTSGFTETTANENGATQVTQEYVFSLRGRSQAYRNAVEELTNCNCGMTIIHGENTGLLWIWGYDETEEAFLTANVGTSGVAKTDPNQEAVTLTAIASKKALVFADTVPV